MEKTDIVSNPELVAYCGLYCGACGSYRGGRCPGCRKNEKATWCTVRTCGQENRHTTCADCREFQDPNQCKKFNNLISRIFGWVFHSDRAACIVQIHALGVCGHADEMARTQRPTIRR